VDRTKGVFPIEIAAELTGLHPQTLRKYEKEGFITPERRTQYRFYSEKDIEDLKYIKSLSERVHELETVRILLSIRNLVNSNEDPQAVVEKIRELIPS